MSVWEMRRFQSKFIRFFIHTKEEQVFCMILDAKRDKKVQSHCWVGKRNKGEHG